MSLSIYHTHTHSFGCMIERGEVLSSERERNKLWRSSFLFSGFTIAIGAHSISEEVRNFLLYGFSEENSLCLLYLVFIVVHVILSIKDPKIIMLA